MYGEDASKSKDYSRVINVFHTKRIVRLLEGQQENIYFQTGKVNVEEKFIPPTILLGVDKSHPLIQEEIFGPLLPILTFKDIGEIVDDINDGQKSLNVNYYGDVKGANFKAIKEQTSSGALLANDHFGNYLSVTTGFGGVGNSGYGRIRGFAGFKELSHEKVIIGEFLVLFIYLIDYKIDMCIDMCIDVYVYECIYLYVYL